MGKYTVGLKQVKVGTAVTDGDISASVLSALTKTFKVYNDTCEVVQDAPSLTEHKEENNAVPVVVLVERTSPRVKFQMMETDATALIAMLGGTAQPDGTQSGTTGFGFDGTDEVSNQCFMFEALQGMDIYIPNGRISANLSGKMSKTGILLCDVEVIPEAVTGTGKKPFVMRPHSDA